jgi:hypothetical protein
MWRMTLGIGILLQAGVLRAGEEGAVRIDCPDDGAANQDCTAEEVPATEAPPFPIFDAPPPHAATAPAAAPADTASRYAFATVRFRNDVGKKFRLVEARFTMDGADVSSFLSSPERGKSYVVLSGPVKPGRHVVTAHLTYQGERPVFNYMRGYKLNVSSDQVLTAPDNRSVTFTVVGTENLGMTVPLDKRVVVKVEESAR